MWCVRCAPAADTRAALAFVSYGLVLVRVRVLLIKDWDPVEARAAGVDALERTARALSVNASVSWALASAKGWPGEAVAEGFFEPGISDEGAEEVWGRIVLLSVASIVQHFTRAGGVRSSAHTQAVGECGCG